MLAIIHPAPAAAPWRATSAPTEAPLARLLSRVLDELDYGILLLAADGRVLHLNHRARLLLNGEHALQLQGPQLRARLPQDVAPLCEALQATALRGLRRLLPLGHGAHRRIAALVPVSAGTAALVLGKDQVCEELSIQCFARSHALTTAETRVLAALGSGVRPSQIARDHCVKLSTVRSQIGAIREKTGTASITALVRLVAALPPMVGALRA